MDFKNILVDISSFVAQYFNEKASGDFLYHNYEHTSAVVTVATELSNHYQLPEREHFIVLSAAWLHDLGYFIDQKAHEAASVRLVTDFLVKRQVPEVIIEEINTCILATKMPQRLKNPLQQIVCDADLAHFSTKSFPEQSKQLRKELQFRCGFPLDKNEWRHQTVALMENHHYHTGYSKNSIFTAAIYFF